MHVRSYFGSSLTDQTLHFNLYHDQNLNEGHEANEVCQEGRHGNSTGNEEDQEVRTSASTGNEDGPTCTPTSKPI